MMSSRSHPERPAHRALIVLMGLALPLAAGAALAQSPPDLRGPVPADEKSKRERELDSVRTQQKDAVETQTKLRGEIATLTAERRKLNLDLIQTAERLREFEAKASETQSRVKALDDNEQAIRASLSKRRAAIAEVLAALQRIGHQPMPALLAQPDDALSAVRTAIMLGAVVPDMRVEAQALASDLAELSKVRKDIVAERDKLDVTLAALSKDRNHLNDLVAERQKKQAEAEKALADERRRAAELAKKAESLQDLLAKLNAGVTPPAADKPAPADSLAALKDPGRLTPAIAFAAAKGRLPLPVNGVRVREFGAADKVGGKEKGISIATRPAAQVTSPCDGWVVFAGPFRSYGQLLILNAGGGYHVLLAGMDRISVDLGQFVLTGEPVAVMGGGTLVASAVAIGSSQPILYVEFRKDGTPVDPSPWWAVTKSEKVRG